MKKPVCRSHHRPVTVSLFMILVSTFQVASNAGDKVLNLHNAVPFKTGIEVPPAVVAECELPNKLAIFTKRYAEETFTTVNAVDKPSTTAPGQTLIMEIVGVDSQAGGRFTGKKGVMVEGTLWEDGKAIGSFQATRYSGGGGGFPWKGTCSILGRDVKAIGSDVADWLKKPGMKARLGEAE